MCIIILDSFFILILFNITSSVQIFTLEWYKEVYSNTFLHFVWNQFTLVVGTWPRLEEIRCTHVLKWGPGLVCIVKCRRFKISVCRSFSKCCLWLLKSLRMRFLITYQSNYVNTEWPKVAYFMLYEDIKGKIKMKILSNLFNI